MTEFLDCAMATFLPVEYAERKRIDQEGSRLHLSDQVINILHI